MRLIDADTLKVSITKYCAKHAEHQKWRRLKDHTSELCRDICFLIDAEATVEERKTGKWIHVPGCCMPGGAPIWACSECGKGEHVFGIEYRSYGARISGNQWVACPNCGAKMEGGKDE